MNQNEQINEPMQPTTSSNDSRPFFSYYSTTGQALLLGFITWLYLQGYFEDEFQFLSISNSLR